MAAKTIASAGDAERKALVAVIRRAEDGDPQALAEVRELAKTKLPDLWEMYGNVANIARERMLDVAAGKSPLSHEAMRQKMRTLRAELAGPSPSALERLLAERVVLCWLQSYYEDAIYAQTIKGGCAWEKALKQQKQAETAQRRFLAAVKTLATVRRLALPAIQVNIGEKQVNVSGSGTER